VAMTRAQDRLVLTGAWPEGARRRAAPGVAPSFAELLAPRLEGTAFPEEGAVARVDAAGVAWRLATAAGEPLAPAPAATAPAVEAVDAARPPGAAALLAARRRSARPRAERITEWARRRAAAGPPESAPPAAGAEPGSALGAAFGTAVHCALERLPPEGAGADDIARAALELAPAGIEPRALAAALARFLDGPLGARRRALAGHELARELPLVLRPAGAAADEPTGALVGVLDLLYREPPSGDLVVADFKTDALADDADVADRVARYAPQLRLYGRAVQEALGLPSPPRLELWLLALDRVVEVPGAESG